MRTAFFQSDAHLDAAERVRSMLWRYGVALAIVAVTVAMRLWLDPVVERSGFAIFLIGMLTAAWVGGLGPSLISQTLILFAEAYWFSPTHKVHSPMTLEGVISLLAFYSVGGIVALLSEAWKSAYQRAQNKQNEALAQREQLLTTIACIADAVVVTDAQARLTLMNPAAEALTGWSLADARGKSVRDVFAIYDETSQQTVENPVQRVLRASAVVHDGLRLILTTRKDRRVPVSYTAAPIHDTEGKSCGSVLVFRDETERRRIESALKYADKRKDEFLATLAHELRNPLAPLCTGLEILKATEHNRTMAEEVRSMMERQTKQMVRLIDDLLDISRITRGKLELQKAQVPLADVVRNAVDAVQGLIEDAQHQLVIKLPKEPVLLYVDPNRLTQVVTNLLNNAAKYTPTGGRVELSAEVEAGEVVLLVADNGCGIPSENLDTIFEMFSQGGSAKESGHQGLGIGLTLVKRLVEMHGGCIVAESAGRNQGSRFVVRLPVSQPTPELADHAPFGAATVPVSAKCRALVVDDNPDARISLSLLVKLHGCEVAQAEDGRGAIEMAEAFRPAVVFMDIGMPVMNGYDAARRIREEPWGEDMVLVATTGWGQAEDRRRSQEAGFDRHFVKPVEPTAVAELLASLASLPVPVRDFGRMRPEINGAQLQPLEDYSVAEAGPRATKEFVAAE